MKKQSRIKNACLGLTAVAVASFAHADTLELRNGDILEGLYKGGTQNSIRFDENGSLKTIPVTDVLALTISRELAAVEPPPKMEEITTAEAVPAEPIEPVESVEPPKDILAPAGTPLLVRFVDEVDSRQHEVGHRFAVKLEADFAHDGKIIAPKGSQLYGILTSAKQAGRIKGKTHLTLALTEIRIDDQLYPIATGEYSQVGKKSAGKRSTLKVLGGAAIGAIIHDEDRAEGAAIGAGVGLGAAAITRGEQISIPQDTLIQFNLSAPFAR